MPRTLGFATLLFVLAGSAGIARDGTPPRTDEASRPRGSVLLILKTTLEELEIPEPDSENRGFARSIVRFRFRDAYPRNVGNDELALGSDRLELTCAGTIGGDSDRLRAGRSVCLYSRPDSPEIELCDVHRWYLAREADCDSGFRDRRPLFCMPSEDSCPQPGDEPEVEQVDRKSYLRSGPTPRDMAESQSRNLGLVFDDAAGGYLQVGEALVGREPRARAAGDVNGDGLQDFAIAHAGVSTVTVYLARPNGPPEPVARLDPDLAACALEIRDFGAGPEVDLVVTHCESLEAPQSAWTVFLGDGDGRFRSGKRIHPYGRE